MRTDKSAQIAAAADTKIINAGVNRHSHSGGAHSSCAQKLCLAYNVEGGNENAPDCAEQHQQIMIDAYGVEQQQNNCNAKYGDAEEVIAAFIVPFGKGCAAQKSGCTENNQGDGYPGIIHQRNLLQVRLDIAVGGIIAGGEQKGHHIEADEHRIFQHYRQLRKRKRFAFFQLGEDEEHIGQYDEGQNGDAHKGHAPAYVKADDTS